MGPHWRPQIQRMNRMNWNTINFVGRFETIQKDTRRLLERIGAYEEFGASGWGVRTTTNTNNNNNSTGKNDSLAIFETNLAQHKTGASDKLKEHYRLEETKRLVLSHYHDDYEFDWFNFT